MLVPSMTLPEIKRSLLQDYENEVHVKINALKAGAKRKWLVNGKQDFKETILFTSKSRNVWRIFVTGSSRGLFAMPYVIFYDKVGITASHLTTSLGTLSFVHFNTHFFQRYKERAKIDLDKPEDVVKLFFRKNLSFTPCHEELDSGKSQLFVPLQEGVGLGIHYTEDDIYVFKTFVDNSLLREDQKNKIRDIYTEVLNALSAEVNRRKKRLSNKSKYF
ncbi:MAG TPA: hypothetical protein VHD35_00435 [Chitinophagaceae bacterium]|nr:hypothetical protein [Chitinophagaceae bacterium]